MIGDFDLLVLRLDELLQKGLHLFLNLEIVIFKEGALLVCFELGHFLHGGREACPFMVRIHEFHFIFIVVLEQHPKYPLLQLLSILVLIHLVQELFVDFRIRQLRPSRMLRWLRVARLPTLRKVTPTRISTYLLILGP